MRKRSITGKDKEVALSMKCIIIIMIEKVIAISRFLFFLAYLVYYLDCKVYSSLISEFNEVLNAGPPSIVYLLLLF